MLVVFIFHLVYYLKKTFDFIDFKNLFWGVSDFEKEKNITRVRKCPIITILVGHGVGFEVGHRAMSKGQLWEDHEVRRGVTGSVMESTMCSVMAWSCGQQ